MTPHNADKATIQPHRDDDCWDEDCDLCMYVWCTDECPEDCMADHRGEE